MIIGASAFAIVSGAHFNPAVTVGVWLAGRFPGRDVVPYILAQVIGGLVCRHDALPGSAVRRGPHRRLDKRGSCKPPRMASGSMPASRHRASSSASATGAARRGCRTGLLVLTVLGSTARTAAKGVAPFAIGLALAILVVFTIPFTNGALNPARATAVALFAGDWALTQPLGVLARADRRWRHRLVALPRVRAGRGDRGRRDSSARRELDSLREGGASPYGGAPLVVPQSAERSRERQQQQRHTEAAEHGDIDDARTHHEGRCLGRDDARGGARTVNAAKMSTATCALTSTPNATIARPPTGAGIVTRRGVSRESLARCQWKKCLVPA